MNYVQLEKPSDFKNCDIVMVVSNERNCGIDETTFLALVVQTEKNKLILIPQDFQAHLYTAASKGTSWETEVEWLLGNDVEVYLIQRFEVLLASFDGE